jgi:hypothetical protein
MRRASCSGYFSRAVSWSSSSPPVSSSVTMYTRVGDTYTRFNRTRCGWSNCAAENSTVQASKQGGCQCCRVIAGGQQGCDGQRGNSWLSTRVMAGQNVIHGRVCRATFAVSSHCAICVTCTHGHNKTCLQVCFTPPLLCHAKLSTKSLDSSAAYPLQESNLSLQVLRVLGTIPNPIYDLDGNLLPRLRTLASLYHRKTCRTKLFKCGKTILKVAH